MTLLLPFLPAYVAELGAGSPQAVVQWSGVAFGATFLGAGVMAPVWGRVADRTGRKLILVRASLCMALAMGAIGLVQSVGQLVLLRLLAGLLGGYSSGAVGAGGDADAAGQGRLGARHALGGAPWRATWPGRWRAACCRG